MKEKWTRVKAAFRAAWHVLRGRITVESVDRLVNLEPEGAHVRKTAKGYSRKSRADGYMGPMGGDRV